MLNWIRRRLPRRHEQAEPKVSPGQIAANAALARAHAARRVASDRRPAVDAATADLRLIRERNHFAALIRTTVLGGEGQ